mmetsp:Transcript_17672/g.24561  ORF Transcript_17672/g.24561 Transcript_17672/m.24561 type:complete len:132 (+) Transcript_17672:490-885(+)
MIPKRYNNFFKLHRYPPEYLKNCTSLTDASIPHKENATMYNTGNTIQIEALSSQLVSNAHSASHGDLHSSWSGMFGYSRTVRTSEKWPVKSVSSKNRIFPVDADPRAHAWSRFSLQKVFEVWSVVTQFDSR